MRKGTADFRPASRRNMRLQTKLALSFSVLAIVTSALLTFVLYKTIQGQLREDIRERLRNIASIAALQVDSDAHATLTERAQEGNSAYMGFRIWFFYDRIGFFVNYDGKVAYQPTYRFCPTFDPYGSEINRLNMFLISPESGISLSELTHISPIASRPLDLEQASGLTIDELYSLYNQNSKPICIETPRDIWK